jgi:hypothetical protein
MAVLSGTVSGNSTPANVTSGDFIWTDTGTYACGNTAQPIVYDDSLLSLGLGTGRWVAIKADSITQWAGANVSAPTGYDVYSVSREYVSFAGTTKDCIVVTLVPA